MKQPEQVVAVEKFSIFQALIFKCAFFVVVWNCIYTFLDLTFFFF